MKSTPLTSKKLYSNLKYYKNTATKNTFLTAQKVTNQKKDRIRKLVSETDPGHWLWTVSNK